MASFVVIDAYGFLFRAYYALPQLYTSRGIPVGGVYGFINILLKHLTSHDADYLVVVFDTGTKNFRHTMYPQYKMNRPQLPEDLIRQFSPLREAVSALGIASEAVPHYEADDVIATLSAKYASEDVQVQIITADKDLLQLMGKNVHIFDPIKNRYLTNEYVLDKFGVTSDKILDVLALTGDASDNIPGVPSIGVKTAAKLINQFGSLDNVLNCVEQVEQKKCREMLMQHADQATLSRDLVLLNREVELDGELDKYVKKLPENEQLLAFLQKYELESLLEKIARYYQISLEVPSQQKGMEEIPAQIEEDTATFLGRCRDKGLLAFYAEIENGAVSRLSVACDEECALSVSGENVLQFMEEAKEIFTSDAVLKIVYDAKLIMRHFPDLGAFDDIMLMSYSLDAGSRDHGLDSIVRSYLNKKCPAATARVFVQLHSAMKRKLLSERLFTVYYRLERPLARVLYEMQEVGIEVDTEILKQLSHSFHDSIRSLEGEVYDLAGCKFNIASAKQLGELLFGRMGLSSSARKMRSGSYSTNAEVLTELAADGVEIADKILKWRHFSKLKSTYVDALLRQVEAGTKRVHTNYSMTATATGRISSSNPNLQNIPIRSKEGSEIRKAFVAREGHKLISADYSQMELKIMAHIAGVRAFRDAFAEGRDIHQVTAQQIFGDNAEDPNLRRRAKSINFGIIYGMSPFGLAKNVGITKQEASRYVDQYFGAYPEIKNYMEEIKAYARKHGYTRTVFGRKCYVVGMDSNQHAVRSVAERAAINAPIQGTAADVVKKAMINLHNQLTVGSIILQVHDELLVEVPEDQVDRAAKLIKEVMEGVVTNFSVPLVVDIGVGTSWGDMTKLESV
ncbi:DNA polymerase I [Anaplasma capra]|uniref:DNA polymerase I n=1 Tax=Anaplasma capra TaxID=1562740 RepID=UPI0021D58AA0|nr:DNA polymerase I [Anaplasma capra]MCU7611135.1 DNA polymerase I [Anaplasma capra]MCU7612361.1 DNA polymerase I [Anaplasma capra]